MELIGSCPVCGASIYRNDAGSDEYDRTLHTCQCRFQDDKTPDAAMDEAVRRSQIEGGL